MRGKCIHDPSLQAFINSSHCSMNWMEYAWGNTLSKKWQLVSGIIFSVDPGSFTNHNGYECRKQSSVVGQNATRSASTGTFAASQHCQLQACLA